MTELSSIIKEFVKDLVITFPELLENLNQGLNDILHDEDTEAAKEVYEFCKKTYPEKFFDILYKNDELFTSTIYLLPDIDFSILIKDNISDKTKEIIWKYIQLILFAVVTNETSADSFGDTTKLFEAINEDEFKTKIEETMEQMKTFFETTENSNESSENTSNINTDSIPNPENLHEHISGLLNGKLGRLARDIAEETASEINMDFNDVNSIDDVFPKLFKNPTKLMSLIQKVGNKLDTKMQSGDLKESELLEEASEMISKMNSLPGMNNIKQMLSQMGLNKNSKASMGQMQNEIKRNLNMAKTKERLQRTLQERQAAAAAANLKLSSQSPLDNTKVEKTYKPDNVESAEKTPRHAPTTSSTNKKKKKKRKNNNKK